MYKYITSSDLKKMVNLHLIDKNIKNDKSDKKSNINSNKNNNISNEKKRWNIFLTLQGNCENSSVTSKDIITPLENIKGRLIQSDIYNYFDLSIHKKILVIGAGDGGEVKLFKENGYDTVGTTLHWSDKKFAKNFYDIDLLIEDMHDMSFTYETFDGVFSSHSLEHAISPLIALFEIKRVLKKDGKLYICVPQSGTGNETGIQHYSVLTETLWKHLLDIIGFKDIIVYSESGNTIMKATKDIYQNCPGKHFEIELRKGKMWH